LKREIAVINNQLNDYKISRFNAVEQENILIENLLNDLNTKISLLPEKWFEEKKLETAVQAQSEVIAQIAEIVEAQNISGNLKKNESFHLDFATIPTAPKVLHILVYTFVFTLLGSLFGASLVIFDIIYKGVSVSKENLLLLGKKVFGSIDKGNQEDIKAARKVINFIEDNHKTLSFIHPSCQGFVSLVASLLVKKGKKTLILDLTFLDPNELDPKESTSLKNFLEGDTKGLRPHNSSFGYEYLYGGVYSPFAIELIQRKEFKNLFEALKNQYDIILINLPILPTSFESHLLKDLADKTVIALNEEKLNDLSEFLEDNQNHYGFIFST
jgi:hypothetical protein